MPAPFHLPSLAYLFVESFDKVFTLMTNMFIQVRFTRMDPTNKKGDSGSSIGMKSLWLVFKFLTDVSFSSVSICVSYDFLSQKTKSQPGCPRDS